MQVFDYLFNIGGNFSAKIVGMTEATGKFDAEVKSASGGVSNFASQVAKASVIFDAFRNAAEGMGALSEAGARLDSQMHDLSAVAGVTGDTLKEIEGYARSSAKAFGTDAGVAVEGYKLLLSQLTPELAKCPAALSAMGDSIQTTSKLMGGDGVAAAQVLTTAMNQYGVSMDDPIAASKTMIAMMNTMAAAGQAGSAELPAISAALSQAGMAAKAANVSFEEANAAIQVLDKAGKKGSEGGVALRNTLAILSKGRFLPKDTRKELARAGISVTDLADRNKTLKERLEALKPLLNDSALLSQLFGMENANAARALIQGTDDLGEFTEAVTGTNSAQEQAAVVMDSYAEKQARINQKIEDFRISVFQATEGANLWMGAIANALIPLAQMAPLLHGIVALLLRLKAINVSKLFTDMGNGMSLCAKKAKLLAVGVFTSSLSFGGFQAMGIAACKAVSRAIMSIPIIGWIAAGIAAVIAVVQILWDKCKGFRVVVFTALEAFKALGSVIVRLLAGAWQKVVGMWTSIKDFFASLWEAVSGVAARIYQSMTAFIGTFAGAVKSAYSTIKDIFGGLFAWIEEKINSVLDWFIGLYNKMAKVLGWEKIVAEGRRRADDSWAADHPDQETSLASAANGNVPDVQIPTQGGGGTDPTAGTLGSMGKGGNSGEAKIRNVNITVGRLVDKVEIHTTHLQEGAAKVKEMVAQALLGALNDVNLAV